MPQQITSPVNQRNVKHRTIIVSTIVTVMSHVPIAVHAQEMTAAFVQMEVVDVLEGTAIMDQ